METIKQLTTALVAGEEGQAMVEYPLIIAMVSVVAVVIMGTMGDNIKAAFTAASEKLIVK